MNGSDEADVENFKSIEQGFLVPKLPKERTSVCHVKECINDEAETIFRVDYTSKEHIGRIFVPINVNNKHCID